LFIPGGEGARGSGSGVDGPKVAVQCFGNVGSEDARLFNDAGARVVVIQDHTATLFNPAGIDLVALSEWQLANKKIAGFSGAEVIDDEAFWDVEMDILIPA
ncbi:MAG TPA: glutamate dehydrogenase, partial [Erwinia persicina]|nr:glutamate dehydrogenase [Erwinia persicina]